MKPSERIKVLCKEVCAKSGKHQPNSRDLDGAMPYAIARFLDEEQEKREAAEKAELEALARQLGDGPAPSTP